MNEYNLFFKIKTKEDLVSAVMKTASDSIFFDTEFQRVDYNPNTNLDEYQCYQIKKFSEKEYCTNFLKREFSSTEYSVWEKKEKKIEFTVNTNGEKFYFQKFVKSQFLKKRWFRTSGRPKLADEDIVIINPYANAFYDKKEDVLLFKKLDHLKKIFPKIESLYREATKKEVDDFLGNAWFDASDYKREKMGVRNRKQIALVGNNLRNIEEKEDFFEMLQEYAPYLKINSDKIILKTENDLKSVLDGTSEKFYTTEFTKQKRLANSNVKLNNDE